MRDDIINGDDEILCVSCYNHISNPVCRECYLKQFKLWLKSTSMNKASKQELLNKVKSKVAKESLHDTICILCNNEQVNLCFACFSWEAHVLLKNKRIDKYTQESFLNAFNYKPYLKN